MQFGMGVLNRNDLLALKIEKNAYLHETVWVETPASFIGKNMENELNYPNIFLINTAKNVK